MRGEASRGPYECPPLGPEGEWTRAQRALRRYKHDRLIEARRHAERVAAVTRLVRIAEYPHIGALLDALEAQP